MYNKKEKKEKEKGEEFERSYQVRCTNYASHSRLGHSIWMLSKLAAAYDTSRHASQRSECKRILIKSNQ